MPRVPVAVRRLRRVRNVPDCTGMNASAVFHKSMEAARRRLSLLDDDLDSKMIEGLLSHALSSAWVRSMR